MLTDWQLNRTIIDLNKTYLQPRMSTESLQSIQNILLVQAGQRSHDLLIWDRIGLTYLLQNNLIQATFAWENSPLPYSRLLIYANYARTQQQFNLALKMYDVIASVAPTFRDPWYLKGDLLTAEGDYNEAITSFQSGLQTAIYGSFGESDLYLRLGEIHALHLAEPNYEEAQDLYLKAILADDFQDEVSLIRTYYLNGEVYRILDKPELSMAQFELVLTKAPDHYWANIRLGQLLWEEKHLFSDAEFLLRRALLANPSEMGAYRALGKILLENGRYNEAKIMYEQILNLDPGDDEANEFIEIIQDKIP